MAMALPTVPNAAPAAEYFRAEPRQQRPGGNFTSRCDNQPLTASASWCGRKMLMRAGHHSWGQVHA
jgi:hypothetical protein